MWRKRWVRWVAGLASLPLLLVLGLWIWWAGIDFSHSIANTQATRADLAWLPTEPAPTRGRILTVLTSAERSLQLRAQIGKVLDTHTQAHKVVVDTELGAVLRRNRRVGHDRRVVDQAFDAAQGLGQ